MGNLASVAGLLVSLVGFYFTIRSVKTARQAARDAEVAAKQAKESILSSGAVAKFSVAIGLMEDIKSFQREKKWEILLDRYAQLRRLTIELQNEAVGLTEQDRTILGSVLVQLNDIEKKVEETYSAGKATPDIAKMNGIVSAQIVKVHELSTRFRLK